MAPRRKSTNTAVKTRSEKRAKPGLTHESIVAAAMAVIERDGYKNLTMRKLGKELGVNPMSVYYHIPNKMALTDALVEVIMSSIDLTLDDPGKKPEERAVNAAYIYRDALLAHPTLIAAVASRGPRTPSSLRPVEVLISIFVDAGMEINDAYVSMNALATFVRGYVAREVSSKPGFQQTGEQTQTARPARPLPAEEFPNLVKVDTNSECCGLEAIFDRGTRALIRGLLETYVKNKEA
ncbi:MAG: TetR/AcrR family transcriptional regulator C-terminal domain-containing protein [Actinomycetota bacterium]|mgnify:FL=1